MKEGLALRLLQWHTCPMDITIAISGGTDSLYALLSLREQGHRVTALHARFLPAEHDAPPVPGLAALCESLDVPFIVEDLTEDFHNLVMRPFAEEHARARTPNPCALCNRSMKFGRLFEHAMKHGTAFATGHYAAMAEHPAYGLTLRAGADTTKDQSYFLALVPSDRLRRCLFPLAEMKKTEIRFWLEQHGVTPPIPSESQEICFVPNDDHYAWLIAWSKENDLKLPGPGPAVLVQEGREIARHRGLWQYTEGQRRGLRIPWSDPLYVLGRKRESNTLLVGPKHLLPVTACTASDVNIMVSTTLWPEELFVRVRYHQRPIPAHVEVDGTGMQIRFPSPQTPPAPGQIAAVYDAQGYVLAGGILDEAP